MSLRDRLHLPSAEGKGRFAVTAIGAAAIFGAIFIMAGNSAERKAKEDEEKAMSDVTHILTDSDTRSLGLDSLAARIQSQEREIRDLRTELAKRRTEALPAVSTDPAVSAGMEELRGELESLREELRGAKGAMAAHADEAAPQDGAAVKEQPPVKSEGALPG